jgi:beta-ureidopropionase / N-carbamoyl-L-amino-acid hydrolase
LHVPLMTLSQLRINSERLRDDFEELSQIGATPDGGICRLALSLEDLEARAWFANRIEEAGFLIHDDDTGNLSGVLPSDNRDAKTLLMGSHLDTVLNGGRYDGAIGLLAALECLRTIKESGVDLPVHLEVIDFTDDEGAWQPMLGSKGLTGLLAPENLKDSRGDHAAFRAALTRAGLNIQDVFKAKRDPNSILAYLEMHIEQNVRLENMGIDIGVVTNIVGRTAFYITYEGQARHSGTTSMRERQDALQGAALFVTRAHEMVRTHYTEGVLNCGNIEVKPGALSIVPSEARLTVECRHVNPDLLNHIEQSLSELAQECADYCRLGVHIQRIDHMPAASMAMPVIHAIEVACTTVGVTHHRIPSYASHNAQILSRITPSGMLFIPSVNGVSHNPSEYSHWEDVVNGANTLLHAALHLALNGVE